MLESKFGVHAGHCCIEHGCKYGDADCPVVNKQIQQEYLCESCDEDGIKSMKQLQGMHKTVWEVFDKDNFTEDGKRDMENLFKQIQHICRQLDKNDVKNLLLAAQHKPEMLIDTLVFQDYIRQ